MSIKKGSWLKAVGALFFLFSLYLIFFILNSSAPMLIKGWILFFMMAAFFSLYEWLWHEQPQQFLFEKQNFRVYLEHGGWVPIKIDSHFLVTDRLMLVEVEELDFNERNYWILSEGQFNSEADWTQFLRFCNEYRELEGGT